jgi:hypothetical protein
MITSTGWARALVVRQVDPGEVSSTSILSSPPERLTRCTAMSCPPLERSPDATAMTKSRPKSTFGWTPAPSSDQNRDQVAASLMTSRRDPLMPEPTQRPIRRISMSAETVSG